MQKIFQTEINKQTKHKTLIVITFTLYKLITIRRPNNVNS